jgi:hypothetical protein
MTTIFYSDTATPQKELSPEWFADFNWQNFEHGEIVWLEDNDETSQPAARFLGMNNNQVRLRGVSYAIANREHKVR